MVLRLDTVKSDFAARFDELLAGKREVSEDVDTVVRSIVADVRARGDEALIEYTSRFDRMELDAGGLAISAAEIDEAARHYTASDVRGFLARLEQAPDHLNRNVNSRLLLETLLLHMPAPAATSNHL